MNFVNMLQNFYNNIKGAFGNIYIILIVVIVIGYIQSLIVSSMIDNKLTVLEDKGLIRPKINIEMDNKHKKTRFYVKNVGDEHFTSKNKNKFGFKQRVKKPKEHFTEEKNTKKKSKKEKQDKNEKVEEKVETFIDKQMGTKNFKPLDYKFPYQAYNNEDNCYTSLSYKNNC